MQRNRVAFLILQPPHIHGGDRVHLGEYAFLSDADIVDQLLATLLDGVLHQRIFQHHPGGVRWIVALVADGLDRLRGGAPVGDVLIDEASLPPSQAAVRTPIDDG